MSIVNLLIALALVVFFPRDAFAIPPPDFVVNAGMQIAQIAGIAVFFCSAGITFLYRKFRAFLHTPWRRAIVIAIIILGFGVAWHLTLNS